MFVEESVQISAWQNRKSTIESTGIQDYSIPRHPQISKFKAKVKKYKKNKPNKYKEIPFNAENWKNQQQLPVTIKKRTIHIKP